MNFTNITGLIVQQIHPPLLYYKIPDYEEFNTGNYADVRHNVPALPLEMQEDFSRLRQSCDSWGNWNFGGLDGEYPMFGKRGRIPISCPISKSDSSERTELDCIKELPSTRFYDHIGFELCRMPKEIADKCCENAFFSDDRIFTYEHDFKAFIAAARMMPDTPLEVDIDMFYYWLGALPPIAMGVYLSYPPKERRITFLTSEGLHIAGFYEGDKCYCMGVSGGVRIIEKQCTVDQLFYSRQF